MSSSDDEHYRRRRDSRNEHGQIPKHLNHLKHHRDHLRFKRKMLSFLRNLPPPPETLSLLNLPPPPEMLDLLNLPPPPEMLDWLNLPPPPETLNLFNIPPPPPLPSNFMEIVQRDMEEHMIELDLELQRTELISFFQTHQDEEWFKIKYHPDDRVIEEKKRTMAVKKRLDVFKEFLANGKVDSVSVNAENPDPLIHLLNSVIIKLEGGTDDDLTVLNPIKTFKSKQESEHEKNQTNVGENSDYKVDYNEKDVDENIKRNEVNKTNEAMDVDVQKTVIFNITFNNEPNVQNGVQPRALHYTNSLLLHNIAPTIMKSELETICKQFIGFRRLHIDDPTPQEHWHRHGWVVYDGDVKIDEIFQKLEQVTLGGNKLGVSDTKMDLKDRIRPVNGITNHFQVARNDMKLCVSIIKYLDNRSGLWQSIDGEELTMENTYGIVSHNPVLHNILDFIIDEASAEEEELLGECVTFESEVNTEKHKQLLKALDRMLLYLRIVHSVDFYDYKVYANEDSMPIKCHIMHARGAPSPNPPTDQEIADYCRNFQTKVNSSDIYTHELSKVELTKLGAKDKKEEIKKFITSNTTKLSNNIWLCTLSGKKFKKPELVRKNITKNFNEQLENVKKQVKYFNNYLRDPKRPQPLHL